MLLNDVFDRKKSRMAEPHVSSKHRHTFDNRIILPLPLSPNSKPCDETRNLPFNIIQLLTDCPM